MIKLINSLYLTEKGCCIKNRKFYPVHLRQGEIDGACSIYTLMMNLLILRCVRRKLKRMINRSFGDTVCAEYYNHDKEEAKDGFKNQIKSVLDKDIPIILGIDFKKGGGHAVLAIGYESDDEGLFHIFCLDPGYNCYPTSYWNMVIALDIYKGKYPHQCLTDNPYNCPAIQITETIVVERLRK